MRLVIQGQQVLPTQLTRIAALAAGKFAQIGEHAYCTPVAEKNPTIALYCKEQYLDYAFVADELNLDRIRLVVMDMDSTLISIECIDEIADMYGLKPQVAEITESAMRGEIEFAESLRRRVALLQGLNQGALQRVYDERLRLNPGAEFMLGELKKHNIRTLLVSGGFTFFTDRLKQRLGLDYTQANTLEIIDDQLTGKVRGTILDAQGKADSLSRVRQEFGLSREQVVAIGDGANDLKMMAAAGAGIAYHAKPVVQTQAAYALNHVGLEGVINLLRQP
ncbi:MAG TPA: phosphoserine phosphatase SerB [Novimethylophilus sp.]|jgi:phosphoserine phosphatase|uniref:phosphoserine phosphatase SerB n=1 Tax=Novimethylophilus sp. TaxID=2137426 RepID=UPI002F3E2F41